jgi:endonuclease/exonuclease/phosphatase family metal-dependent hydrolase
MKLRGIFFLIFAILCFTKNHDGLAQDPVIHLPLEPESENDIKPLTKKENAVYTTDLQRPEFAEGISGMALDLSKNASMRSPVLIEDAFMAMYDDSTSFSFQIWVRTLPGAIMGTPIAGNIITEEPDKAGWQIFTQSNGAWALTLSDGENKYEYMPMPVRQRINDGQWHLLSFSLDHKKHEAWLFFDGNNVAILNIPDLRNLRSDSRLVIGGTDEKWEYGSYGQWHAFNGYIDEVKIWKRKVSPAEFSSEFSQYVKNSDNSYRPSPSQIKIMAWNIWHGGHRYGHAVGLKRVIEIIRSSDADIIGLIETYGSGEEIADSLGYYYYLISSNLSILSRFPIVETIQAFRPFNFGGARILLGSGKELVFLNTWLHYLPDYSNSLLEGKSVKEIISAEAETRHAEIKKILYEITPLLNNAKDVPIIMSGDFNSGSHLDWIGRTKDIHYGYEIEWPVSKEMTDMGFRDSFRELHIDPLKDPGFTWTPRAATSSDKYGLQDRIDYIYFQGDKLNLVSSKVVDDHPVMFPSDHAAIISDFTIE